LRVIDGVNGTSFAVWAPHAQRVSVVEIQPLGRALSPMRSLGASGVWEIFIPQLGEGTLYKYESKTFTEQSC